jgi:hypothetical protein
MSIRINARSPFYTTTNVTIGQEVVFSLYVWTGDEIVSPYPDPIYVINNIATAKDNGFMRFEMSEFIRDYLTTEYGNYSTDVLWVQWSVVKDGGSPTFSPRYTACDGYGYFEDGINPELSNQLLQDNTSIYYNDGSDIVIPVWAEDLSNITIQTTAGSNVTWDSVDVFWDNDDSFWGFAYTPVQIADDGNTNQKIQYVVITNTDQLAATDTVTITSTTGGPTTVLPLIKICEPKYTPMNVIFYNKYGALQNMWFFKKNVSSINVSSETYKANIIQQTIPISYATSSHQMQTFNKNGNESINLNSGFYDEQYNEVVQQMLLSEQVWIDNGTQVLPVRPISNSYTFQTNVNDKLINHNLNFEYAFDKINNIR